LLTSTLVFTADLDLTNPLSFSSSPGTEDTRFAFESGNIITTSSAIGISALNAVFRLKLCEYVSIVVPFPYFFYKQPPFHLTYFMSYFECSEHEMHKVENWLRKKHDGLFRAVLKMRL
jgi:hypothetical protein